MPVGVVNVYQIHSRRQIVYPELMHVFLVHHALLEKTPSEVFNSNETREWSFKGNIYFVFGRVRQNAEIKISGMIALCNTKNSKVSC